MTYTSNYNSDVEMLDGENFEMLWYLQDFATVSNTLYNRTS